MSTRTHISMVLFGMFNAVLFGVGLLLALILTSTASSAAIGIALAAVTSVVGGVILARHYAPRLRQRYWTPKDEPAHPIWR